MLAEHILSKKLSSEYAKRNSIIQTQYLKDDDFLQKSGDYYIYEVRDSYSLTIIVLDSYPIRRYKNGKIVPNTVIGILMLTKRELNSGHVWYVQGTFVNKNQRKGVGYSMYKAALNMGITIMCGEEQSESAKGFWRKLASDPTINVWVQNRYSSELTTNYKNYDDAYDPKKSVGPKGEYVPLFLMAKNK